MRCGHVSWYIESIRHTASREASSAPRFWTMLPRGQDLGLVSGGKIWEPCPKRRLQDDLSVKVSITSRVIYRQKSARDGPKVEDPEMGPGGFGGLQGMAQRLRTQKWDREGSGDCK